MISDPQTNTVYLADVLPDTEITSFRKLLEDHGVVVHVLEKTRDYYCRDYMPVQVAEKDFVQFIFKPDTYFKKKDYQYISNPALIHMANKLKHIRYSNIILDGGNVVKWKDKVIITKKVIADNMEQFNNNESALIKELEDTLKCRVIFIQAYPGEETGHADGLVRFINEKKVFINEPEPDQGWSDELISVLNTHNLSCITLPCPMKPKQKTGEGLYINFLQVGKLIVVPKFNMKEDQDAFDRIRKEFSEDFNVVQYDARAISKYGGVLNCATWTVRNGIHS